jgi:hypothetical protein
MDSRRHFLKSASAAAMLQPEQPARKPNFVFFMPETLGAESRDCQQFTNSGSAMATGRRKELT